MLFNLATDVREKKNLADDEPEILERLLKKVEQVRSELGDLDRVGSDQRVPNLENPQEK